MRMTAQIIEIHTTTETLCVSVGSDNYHVSEVVSGPSVALRPGQPGRIFGQTTEKSGAMPCKDTCIGGEVAEKHGMMRVDEDFAEELSAVIDRDCSKKD